jgi:hypothetical protein
VLDLDVNGAWPAGTRPAHAGIPVVVVKRRGVAWPPGYAFPAGRLDAPLDRDYVTYEARDPSPEPANPLLFVERDP